MKRITILFISLFVIASLALAGCQPAEAELGTEENPIVWALVPSGETDTVLSGFQDVVDIIYDETGLVIEPFVATEYAGVIEAMAADPPKAHMASLATFAYMLASERGIAEAELVSVRYGSPSYNGQIFVRSDSGITSVADLGGKTFCGVDPLSTSGWIIPSFTLGAAGVNPDTDLEGVVFAGSHDAAVAAVYNGDCDAGASFVDARSNLTDDYPDIMEALTVIEVSVDVPNDGVQYHPSVSREIRDQINNVLLTIHETEEGLEAINQAYEWTELSARDDSFYEPFRQILDAAGVNIQDYMGD
jgi:phosphonate transport system substrate-binding protein